MNLDEYAEADADVRHTSENGGTRDDVRAPSSDSMTIRCERCGAPGFRFADGDDCGPCSAVTSNEACDPTHTESTTGNEDQ